MALKDLSSLYDLVGGNQPVGDMENQQGGTPFDLGPDSTLQQNSLPEIPVNSPYQDLDAVDGGNGYFHNIPNPGKFQGKQVGGVDLHEHLLTNPYNYTFGNSPENVGPSPGQTGNSEYQDLDAVEGGNGYFHGIANPLKYQGKQVGGIDLHEHLLTNPYNYTYGNSSQFYNSTVNVGPAPGPTGNSEYQDLDAVDGGNGYFHGIANPGKYQGKQLGGVDLHEALLQNTPYNYTYGTPTQFYNPIGQAGPYQTEPYPLDLNGGLPSTGKYEDNMPS